MTRIRALLAALLLAAPSLSFGQSAILQGGAWTAGHAPMFSNPAGAQPVVQDSGTAANGAAGLGFLEWLQVNRAANGVTTAPYGNSGTGPYYTHNCAYDAPTTGPYHYLCFDANAQNSAVIVTGAGGGATAQPFEFIINGATYQLPFTVGGAIVGPGSSTVGDFACWNNTTGTLLKDCGTISLPAQAGNTVLANATNSSAVPTAVSINASLWAPLATTPNGASGIAILNSSGYLAATQGGTGIGSLGSGVQSALGNAAGLANGLALLNGFGVLSVAQGGNGTAAPGVQAGANISVSGSWPTQTIAASGVVTGVTAGFGVSTSASGGSGGTINSTGTLYYDPTQVGWDTRNRLYNSGMVIDQVNAGAAYTLAALSGVTNYTLDGWYVYESTAGTGLTAQQVQVRSGGVNYAQKIARASSSTNTNTTTLLQVVETNNMIDLQGQAVTFSFRAAVGANWSGSTPTVSIVTGTGVDQGTASLAAGSWTGQATCGSATRTLTTSFAFYVVTCTVPSGATEIAAEIAWTWSGTALANDWIEVTDAELVPGTYTATQIVPERPSIQRQLAACQRYFATSYPLGTAAGTATTIGMVGGAINSTTAYAWSINVYLPSIMRASPSISYWDGAGDANKVSYIAANGATFTHNVSPNQAPFNVGTNGFFFGANSNAGYASSYLHYTANARL